jgi:hypothetical protein
MASRFLVWTTNRARGAYQWSADSADDLLARLYGSEPARQFFDDEDGLEPVTREFFAEVLADESNFGFQVFDEDGERYSIAREEVRA